MEKLEKGLTIRMPAHLLEAMRRVAEAHTRSLNSEILTALRAHVIHNAQKRRQGEDEQALYEAFRKEEA